ncbi:MAG: hypothetical protein D6756_11445 [Cyanobacteria bacterium J083]|nr:MAG: hypothetical protein D6756_11445 [Cyanobacteria bacterium J083]
MNLGKKNSFPAHSENSEHPPLKPKPMIAKPILSKGDKPARGNKSQQDTLQPIPPPSNPRQYRAIGLIRGRYQPSEEQLTQGTLITEDGTEIEAVILGRIISLVKNHLDLSKNHLWVVYPRTRQENDNLHVQIVGVWEPETLHQDKTTTPQPFTQPEDGYFSFLVEVVFYSAADEKVIVKIKQRPRKEGDKWKFFKLQLKGILSEKPLRRFWDLKAKLQGQTLVIQAAEDLGLLQIRKKPGFRKSNKPRLGNNNKGKPTKSSKPFKRTTRPKPENPHF